MKKVVVVGNGMVGYKFLEKLRAKAGADQIELIVYGEEPLHAYDRVHLSEYFASQKAEDLEMAPRSWYDENQVTLKTSQLITEIDRSARTVKTHNGDVESYDYLIMATGSSAMVPPINGVDKKGVFVYRTIEDLEQIIEYAKTVKRGAVLGGGLLGLEAAKALMDLNLDAQVIEFAPRLMPRQLDQRGSDMLKSKIESLGIEVLLGKNTQKINGNGKLTGLDFADGSSLETEMLVISCGIVSRSELAGPAKLETGKRGGFKVNDQMQTNDPYIYAIGEAASYNDMIYGLVAPGYDMADVVVDQLIGSGERSFTGADMSTKLKLIGTDVGSFGDALGETEGCIPIVFEDKHAGIYKRVNLSPDKKSLLGGILVGDATQYSMLLQTVQNGLALPKSPEDLILGARGGEGDSGDAILALPDSAQICSCENVTKADIVGAIKEQGCEDVPAIKACTKAGTGCGACTPMVADLFASTMKSMGQTVRKVICSHFDYTRQELFDLIKVKEVKSYDELLDTYGTGDGCEICKPAVASLLASAWNDLILKQDTIQDTNDRFLANIQKGGSYSVVPRVPGGEITPDKLIALGEVAKKFDLYTKITGGQRIDLFGAKINDLPKIWRDLIDAGFESGHAYGKALRTVKSCVGSTWCRYGLHDSVSFAIEIENRYKGLRSPHKLKGAVSGCRRECAEAQGKDFGLIATEIGYNLYVCGNGGVNPQHALLLAGDIDEKTAIKYLDRFLMFYIKTAEPLNRTSVWLNKLEGGIDYLIDVVVNDSLGIGEELEKDMQALIAAYHCEWKEAINDEKMAAKFKHFANNDEHDPAQQFVPMREMKKPADWD
ncbi:nitrite reductase large subunit NirB [Marinoscillum sp. MHG1-6]|uniref:nitrite reductase large subunit NirB n=1 Tax=Marinoscillum sp. MHG1-6 TaxID=2959627 RepID=UPI002157EF7D|nr:nitrite reductase large subunit NirB [Marinoscillum sp. MHG1-6]